MTWEQSLANFCKRRGIPARELTFLEILSAFDDWCATKRYAAGEAA